MVKRRPVIIISPKETHGRKLCTVIPLSTTRPNPEQPWHHLLKRNYLPDQNATWAKCDMIYTVSFARLDRLRRKTRKGREYFVPKIDEDEMVLIMTAIKSYLKNI